VVKKGRANLFGIPDAMVPELDIRGSVAKVLALVGSHSASPLWKYSEVLQLMSPERVKVAPLIAYRFPLNDINDAFPTAVSGREKVLKIAMNV
jgi:threonine dehydrogenase-like Zn-dependent dehydrogenase